MPSTEGAETIIVRGSVARPREWDAFAQRAGASFRCAYCASWGWQFESHRLFRLRRIELFVATPDGERKIGQCAVGVGRRRSVFADGLQLLTDFRRHWPAAMSAVVEHLGDADYEYGSEWSLEPPREHGIARLAGVTVQRVSSTGVQVIELDRWATFDEYVRAVSSNVRRNVKKAEKSYTALHVSIRLGLRGLGGVLRSIPLRRSLFRRKGVERSSITMGVRSLFRLAVLSRYSEVASLTSGRTTLSSYVGLRFGSHVCYMEGASDRDGKGTSWFLLMAMIERAFEQTGGRGRFVMGSDDGSQAGVESWEGLRRSRRQCCATAVETSVVRFRYRAASARAEPFPTSRDSPAPTADAEAILVAAPGRSSASRNRGAHPED